MVDDAQGPVGVRDWTLESTTPLADARIFELRREVWRSPKDGVAYDFSVVASPDWVNVVALTEAGQVVLIRQFRVGTRAVTLEIPGGAVERGEDPLQAAQRELEEETGYTAARWSSLGMVEPNPAFQDNRCHFFLAEGARRLDAAEARAHPTEPDSREDIVVEERPLAEVPALVVSGAITHALVLNAFYRLELWQRGVR